MDKVIFNSVNINWFGINKKELEIGFNSIGIQSYPLDEYDYINNINYENVTDINIYETYLGFSLFDIAIYSICNDLIIFKDELKPDLHKDIIFKWYSLAKTIINDFERIFKKNKFSLVIVVNGHTVLDACLLAYAKKFNFPFLCIENTSNKNRIVWDNISGKVVTYNLAKCYFHLFKNKIDVYKAKTYSNNFKHFVFKNKSYEHLSNISNLESPIKEPYILYLGQVYCDASQLFAIKEGFKNPINVIIDTIDICNDLNIPLVIKLHPKEIDGKSPAANIPYSLPTYNRIKKYKSENVIIDYDNTFNTFKLIENSLIVITLNSQAGLEACLYDKPVLCYHNCFYSDLGFTYDYQNQETLNDIINELIENKIKKNKNLILAQKFFYIFFEEYCIKNAKMNFYNKILKSGQFSKMTYLRFTKLVFKNTLKRLLNFKKIKGESILF